MNVASRRCTHEDSGRHPNLRYEGIMAGAHGKQRALDHMVHKGRRCAHDRCSTRASFSLKGNAIGIHCKHHTPDGMVQFPASVVLKRVAAGGGLVTQRAARPESTAAVMRLMEWLTSRVGATPMTPAVDTRL